MSNWVYTDSVKEHFRDPKNILDDEEAYKPDGRGIVGNIKCGDQMLIVIKVADGKIADCKWKTYGCASAIASTSILSEVVKGMDLKDAYHIQPKDIAEKLGGLPENKIHCSVLGDKALRAAIKDYYTRRNETFPFETEKARVVCQCMNVTDADIEKAVNDGVRDWKGLQEHTKAGTVCGQCEEECKRLIHEYEHLLGS
jgi:nitrogen fixation NifU-like protein